MSTPTMMERDSIATLAPADQKRILDEIAGRPEPLPLNQRHYFTAQELQDIRDGKPEAMAKIRFKPNGEQSSNGTF
jgi:hypothetical protein